MLYLPKSYLEQSKYCHFWRYLLQKHSVFKKNSSSYKSTGTMNQLHFSNQQVLYQSQSKTDKKLHGYTLSLKWRVWFLSAHKIQGDLKDFLILEDVCQCWEELAFCVLLLFLCKFYLNLHLCTSVSHHLLIRLLSWYRNKIQGEINSQSKGWGRGQPWVDIMSLLFLSWRDILDHLQAMNLESQKYS